jgi:hypothetical protein
MPPVSALWFCLLPLLDMGGISIRRILRRRSPFNADREHLHHVFTLAKFSVTETTGAMALIALLGVLLGTAFVFSGVPERGLFLGFLTIAAIYLWSMMRTWKLLRFLSRSIDRRVQNVAPDVLVDDRRSRNAVLEVVDNANFQPRSATDRRTAPQVDGVPRRADPQEDQLPQDQGPPIIGNSETTGGFTAGHKA